MIDKATILTVFTQYMGMAMCRFFPAPAKAVVPRNGAVLLHPPKSFFTASPEIRKGIYILKKIFILIIFIF